MKTTRFLDKLYCLALVSAGLCQHRDKQKGTDMKVKEGQKENRGQIWARRDADKQTENRTV